MAVLTCSRSAVEAWSKSAPGVAKWTKLTVAQHITVGGLGATVVGTPEHVADEFERWVREADVDGFNIVRIAPQLLDIRGTNGRRLTPSNLAHSLT